jgi:putative DNA primase/helicase
LLVRYFGAKPSPYVHAIGTLWMISAIARVYEPGCQADYMIVLEGKQGRGKSTGLEALVPDKAWFSDTGVTPGEKDSYQQLRGKWVYEFGELDSLKRSQITKTKNFLSAREDNYRPSFGRRNRDFPRQCVFAGTTNEPQYLEDRTGNRRFWPAACTQVDVDAIRADRDQLWAEARTRYKRGEKWWPTPELTALCEDEQIERLQRDPWEDIIGAWLAEPTEPSVTPEGRPRVDRFDISDGIETHEVLRFALGKRPGDITKQDEMRVTAILRDLGWQRGNRQRIDGRRVYRWRKVGSGAGGWGR